MMTVTHRTTLLLLSSLAMAACGDGKPERLHASDDGGTPVPSAPIHTTPVGDSGAALDALPDTAADGGQPDDARPDALATPDATSDDATPDSSITPDASMPTKSYFVAQHASGSGRSNSDRMSVTVHNATLFDAGSTIYLCGEITSRIVPRGNGAKGAPITYRGDCPKDPLRLNATRPGSSIDLSGRSYITLTNKDARPVIDGQITSGSINGSDSGPPLIDIDGANQIVIDNWELRNAWNGISGKGMSNIAITRNYVHHMRANCLFFNGDRTLAIDNNVVIGGSEKNGNEFYRCTYKTAKVTNNIGADIRLVAVTNMIVSYNHCHGTDGKDTDGWGLAGIMSYGNHYGVIEYNTIHDHGAKNFRAGIHCKGPNKQIGHHIVIRYNHIYDEVDTKGWDYTNAGAIGVGRNNHDYWIYGNRVSNCGAGISVNNCSAASSGTTDGIDGEHVHDMYLWANVVTNVQNYGIAFSNGSSDNTDDMYNLYAINNTVHKALGQGSHQQTAFYTDFSGKNAGSGKAPFMTVKNNILSEGRYGDAQKYSVFSGRRNAAYLNIANNLHYDSRYRSKFKVRIGWKKDPACYTTPCDYDDDAVPAAWFQHAKIGKPGFKAADKGSLALAAGALATNAGEVISLAIPTLHLPFYQKAPMRFSFAEVLDPKTDWSRHPPRVVVGHQNKHGAGPEIGAYVFPE